MSKYQVDINVNSNVSGRRGAGAGTLTSTPRTRQDLRENMQQVRETKKALSQAQKKDPSLKTSRQLNATIQRLDRSINKLNASINQLSNRVRAGGMGGGVRGAGGGVAGAATGRVGGSIPLVGVMVAAFGYALSKVMQLGRASMSKIMEQRGTAGVSGLVRPTAMGQYRNIMSAAEMGQYLKEARMAAGTFDVDVPGTRRKQESQREFKRRQREDLGYKTAAIFGTGTQFARTMGLATVGARMRGETGRDVGTRELTSIIQQTFRGQGKQTRGVGTELPALLREITTNMEDAVREGVDGSNIARDMASEMVTIARVTPGGQVRSAMQIQKSMTGIQKQAALGQGGVAAWRMNMAARGLLTGQGTQSERARERLVQAGLMSKDQQRALAAGENLGPEQMQFLAQSLQSTQAGEVRQSFVQDIVKTLGGKGTRDEQMARFHRIAQKMMPELRLTPQRSAQLFDYAQTMEARKAGKGTITTRGETGGIQTQNVQDFLNQNKVASVKDAESVMARRMKERGGEVRGVQYQMSRRESMLFTKAAAKSREAVIKVETSMMNLANKVAGPVTKAIGGFNTSIEYMTAGVDKVIAGMTTLVETIQEVQNMKGSAFKTPQQIGFEFLKKKIMD